MNNREFGKETGRGSGLVEVARVRPALIVAILLAMLSIPALLPRLAAEKEARNAAIVLDYRDLAAFSEREGRSDEELWLILRQSGAMGLMVSELTGQQLSLGAMKLYYGPASGLPGAAPKLAAGNPMQASMFIPKGFPGAEMMPPLLNARFEGVLIQEFETGTAVLLPRTLDELLLTGVVPDVDGLLLASKHDIPVFYRPAPALAPDTGGSLTTLESLLLSFPQIRTVSPSAEVALGYPDLRPLADVIRRHDRSVAAVEFSRQVGAVQLNWLAYPRLIPLHSVTNEEILSRGITRIGLHERFMRAVKERAIRLLVFRPSAIEVSSGQFDFFQQELHLLASNISSSGVALSWPEPYQPWRTGVLGALALSLALVFTALRFLQRFIAGASGDTGASLAWRGSGRGLMVFGGMVVLTGMLILFVPAAARSAGALTAVLLVTEASFIALDSWRRPWFGILGSFLFVIAGGLAIAAFFSDPLFMLRLRTFSGVKATLFLPPLLLLLADFKSREHPESLVELFRRPPLWGEMILLALLLGGAVLVLFRSDNVQFVPAFEVRVREMLERALVARPRSKEVFLGYPALLIWYFVRRVDMWPRYREVFRLATVVGFSSAVNSFCHFHTPLHFILFRQFNGLWTGLLVGTVSLLMLKMLILPLWTRHGKMMTG
ncbi:MAG: hypothetical protein GX181_08650 [Synergistaceae bacterium]|nr:DUF5693 family protein [Synergistota bacterium]NLM72008.1 hypothetical protein [Synergistaceae bacterium]